MLIVEQKEFIEQRLKLGIKPGLSRVLKILDALSVPQKTPGITVTIAGTNGKGSVAAFTESLWFHSGKTTLLYTSPHLVSVRERIRINGKGISESLFNQTVMQIVQAEKKTGITLTWFELLTVSALVVINRAKPQVSILEVGMGGRLDAVNSINPDLTIITKIAKDHTQFIGDTYSQIALEKLGITRNSIPLVTAWQNEEALNTILHHTQAHSVPTYLYNRDFWMEKRKESLEFYFPKFVCQLSGIKISLAGDYQVENAALALAGYVIMNQNSKLDSKTVLEALSQTKHPARLQTVRLKGTTFVLDGAHNLHAAKSLVSFLNSQNKRFDCVICGFKFDKPAPDLVTIVSSVADSVIVTRLKGVKHWQPEKVLESLPTRIKNKVSTADSLEVALENCLTSRYRNVLVTGSLFLAGEFCKILRVPTVDLR